MRVRVLAFAGVRDILGGSEIGLELPDGEYDTVAGLVLERLERLAEVGDSVVVDGVLLEVSTVDGYAIERLVMRVDPGGGSADSASESESDAAGADPEGADDGGDS